MKRLISFLLSLILFILTIPLFLLYCFLAYRRYLTRLYTNMVLMMSLHRMMEAAAQEEW